MPALVGLVGGPGGSVTRVGRPEEAGGMEVRIREAAVLAACCTGRGLPAGAARPGSQGCDPVSHRHVPVMSHKVLRRIRSELLNRQPRKPLPIRTRWKPCVWTCGVLRGWQARLKRS